MKLYVQVKPMASQRTQFEAQYTSNLHETSVQSRCQGENLRMLGIRKESRCPVAV